MDWNQYMDSADLYNDIENLDVLVKQLVADNQRLRRWIANLKCLTCEGTGEITICRECNELIKRGRRHEQCEYANVGSWGGGPQKCYSCRGTGKDFRIQ
jgi:hypothetical protein